MSYFFSFYVFSGNNFANFDDIYKFLPKTMLSMKKFKAYEYTFDDLISSEEVDKLVRILRELAKIPYASHKPAI
jgi:hypothetical protein